MDTPVLKAVTFAEVEVEPSHTTLPEVSPPMSNLGFINTTQGASTGLLEPGVIPTSPTYFIQAVAKLSPPHNTMLI
jgi:hypothetical protein